MYKNVFKRVIDLSVSLVLAMALAPVWLFVAGLVWWRLGLPVLFKQTRAGFNGKPFDVVKFRTMTDVADEQGNLLPDVQRLARLGRFLRASSLDELPQLWNVIRGQMSLIGPRPLLLAYVDRYNQEQRRRLDVMPGITGWAQVNGRNAISWEERFRLDTWYVDHCSLALDVRIGLLTVWRLLVPRGINSQPHVTMPEFMGSARD